MRQLAASVERVTLLGPGLAEVRVRAEAGGSLRPGQFALARSPDPARYLRVPLFPRAIDADGFSFETALRSGAASEWTPGASLDLLAPAGVPLRLPDSTRHLLLIAGRNGPARLLPAAELALRRSAAITLLLGDDGYPLNALPAEIEVRQGTWDTELPDALAWADFVLVEADDLPDPAWSDRLAAARLLGSRTPAFAFIAPSTPCGTGACGACAVQTRGGWRLACVDGPLFDVESLSR